MALQAEKETLSHTILERDESICKLQQTVCLGNCILVCAKIKLMAIGIRA